MSTFTFLNPLYLIGLVSAAIPLIIHLSRSRRTKKIRFSTTRFFTDQFLRSYRMSRIKEVLLLITRMALFGLLAMALAQPFLRPQGSGNLAGSGGARTVVLVLDDSASMAYTEDGVTLFQKAKEAAAAILQNLTSGDTASIVLAGRRASGPEVLFIEPTPALDEVRSALDKVQAAPLATDLSGAIQKAEELTQTAQARDRSVSIYVLSDLQESGWEAPTSDSLRADQSRISYFFVGIRPKQEPANRAVTAVRYAATRPRVGVPFAIRPLLALLGDDRKDVSVRLYVDGEKVAEQKVERLPGGRWAAPRFYHTFSTSGWHAGYVEVDDDNLAHDNHRYFALEVPETTQTVPVLAVNGAPSNVPSQDELFFLRLALEAAPEGQSSPFKLTAIGVPELGAADLSKFPLVVLANVERLGEAVVEKLEEYVDRGGQLLVFVGDKVNPAFYNDVLAGRNRRHEGLLPGRFKEGAKVTPAGYISALEYEHRALAAFQEPKLGTLLCPSLTFQVLPLEAPEGSVLMKTQKGLPLLTEKAYGKGRVLLFTSTCDRDWTDFPIRPAFLLWSRFVAEYLTQTPLSLQTSTCTGDAVPLTVPPGKGSEGLWVRKPDGSKAPATRSEGGSGLEFGDTLTPGIYTVLGADQETRIGLFAVNLENHESDLSYLDDGSEADPNTRREQVEKSLRNLLGQPPVLTYVDNPSRLGEGLSGGRRAVELWNIALVIVLLIGLFEPWLANQISARLYTKRKEPVAGEVALTVGATAASPGPVAEGATR
jgi:hypothetical protein